jgi:ABC-type transport system involved in multi-copper enzyme maturation permease subunit
MRAAILARFVLIEARRGGLPWLAVVFVALCIGLAAFLSQVALTEKAQLQAAVVAAVLRAGAVFLVTAFVASSTLREINDKALEMLMSLPLSRAVQYLGRLAGFAGCGAALAAAFCLPLLLWIPAARVVWWGFSLALEASLMAAVALFFTMSLTQLVPAIAATLGLYLLARFIPAFQAIASGPLAEPSLAQELARWCLDTIALLLPPLDAATRTEWLLYGSPAAGTYAAAMAGMVLYAALMAGAGLFDFYRRSL